MPKSSVKHGHAILITSLWKKAEVLHQMEAEGEEKKKTPPKLHMVAKCLPQTFFLPSNSFRVHLHCVHIFH